MDLECLGWATGGHHRGYVGTKKATRDWVAFWKRSLRSGLAAGGLLGAANGTETLLELVDASLCIDELLLPGEEGV